MPILRVPRAPLGRDQLDVSLSTNPIPLESLIHRYGAIHAIGSPYSDHRSIAANIAIADAAIIFIGADQMRVPFRADFTAKNMYTAELNTPSPTEDWHLKKYSAGSYATLGREAVDLNNIIYTCAVSAIGSTLKLFRDDLTTAKVTVTNTSFTSGYWGVGASNAGANFPHYAMLRSPMSLVPRPVAYFEVPITGSGTPEDPFRAEMPEQIVEVQGRGKVNLLAVSHSALIPTDSSGRPKDSIAIVRVFEQPDRDPSLRPISDAIDALRSIRGARKLEREAAIMAAKRLDDKLHDVDLLPARELGRSKKELRKEYIEWREYTLGVKRDLIKDELMDVYAEEDKGW